MREAATLLVQHSPKSSAPDSTAGNDLTLRLHAEEISVSQRVRAGQTVRVSTVTSHHEELVDTELTHERVEIERVPIGREVNSAPPPREEGDVTVISVVEEMVVVERRLILKEEVRIRKIRITERHRETVMLREQEAVITRTGPAMPDGLAGDNSGETPPSHLAQEQQ